MSANKPGCRGEVLTGKGCSPPPRPPWRTAATSAATAAGWRSPSAWTWWRTGPTRWNPGTPGGGTREQRTWNNLTQQGFFFSLFLFFYTFQWIIKWLRCKFLRRRNFNRGLNWIPESLNTHVIIHSHRNVQNEMALSWLLLKNRCRQVASGAIASWENSPWSILWQALLLTRECRIPPWTSWAWRPSRRAGTQTRAGRSH